MYHGEEAVIETARFSLGGVRLWTGRGAGDGVRHDRVCDLRGGVVGAGARLRTTLAELRSVRRDPGSKGPSARGAASAKRCTARGQGRAALAARQPAHVLRSIPADVGET